MKVELSWDERRRIVELARNDIEQIQHGNVHYFDNDEARELDEMIIMKMVDHDT